MRCEVRLVISQMAAQQVTSFGNILYRVFQYCTVRLLETRFKTQNCFREPGPQEPYRDIF
jgi:hypothetical protein